MPVMRSIYHRMKKCFFTVVLLFVAINVGYGQNIRPSSNIGNNEYPQITPDLRVVFRVNAPRAKRFRSIWEKFTI